MFEVYCPAHRAHVLLTTSRIVLLSATAEGLVIDWRCWCGHHGRSIEGRTRRNDRDRSDTRRPPPLPAAS
jgi:hypothetical protein